MSAKSKYRIVQVNQMNMDDLFDLDAGLSITFEVHKHRWWGWKRMNIFTTEQKAKEYLEYIGGLKLVKSKQVVYERAS